jgi:hypothetical protein
VIKDARLDDGAGPMNAVLLGLCAVALSDDGEVHDARELARWAGDAGLEDVRAEPVGDAVVVMGRKRSRVEG